jgi:hypothetical protein
MTCTRCASEVPGQAQFCMKCGTPVNPATRQMNTQPGPTAAVPRQTVNYTPAKPNRTGLYAGIAAAVVALAVLAFFGFKNLTDRSDKVGATAPLTDLNARAVPGGPLTDKSARLRDSAPLTDRDSVATPAPADPVEIIDYLKHVRETERQRVSMAKRQLAQVLSWTSVLQAGNLTAEMGDNPEQKHQETYNKFQQDISRWGTEWEELSRYFNSYPKPVPQACAGLRDRYLDALGKTSSSMVTVGGSFASAMSGNASGALEALTKMQGDQSIDVACEKADDELRAVCDRYKLHKDFDIKADGGAANPFGLR